MIVVIDGPAGAGKSSTAKDVAAKAGIRYIDSGAMYRGFSVLYLACSKNRQKFFDLLDRNGLEFQFDTYPAKVLLHGENISGKIRSHQINDVVSEVAAISEVRAAVLKLLMNTVSGTDHDYIAEGRDLGTVVFPDADLKFFLTADVQVRAQRRLMEMSNSVGEKNLESVKQNLLSRDQKDSSRKEAPLVKAEDAIEIDTTSLGFDEQVQIIVNEIERLQNNPKKT